MAENQVELIHLKSQIEEDYLTCHICQGPYTKPKALSCLHSFCTSCLSEYLSAKKVSPGGTFECPICRNTVDLPMNGIGGFPDNHLIVSLADTINGVNRPAFLRQKVPDILVLPQRHNTVQFPAAPEEARTSQEPEAGTSRRESTGSDRASINRMRDIQRQEVLDLIRCLSDITDRLHVSRDLNEGHLESGSFRQDFGQNFALHSGSTPQPGTSYGHHRHNSRPLTANSILYPGTTETPSVSLMQIRFDEFPSYPSFGELPYFREHAGSGIRTYHTNREPDPMRNPVGLQSRSSFSRLQDSEPAGYSETEVEVPGYYPAVMLETESGNQRTIPSNPAPIKTLGQFGMGMFDLCTPIGLTTAHQGNTVLVSDQSQCRILMFDLESGEMQGSIKCEGEIKDLTVSTMGHILVATHKAGSSLATAYTFDGHKIASLGRFFAHESAHGISANSNHKVAITCLSGAVYILNENGEVLHQFGKRGRDMNLFATPYYVTFNHKQRVLISDCDANSVKVYDCSGQFQFSFGGSHAEARELSRPSGLTVDMRNNIIVSDFGSGSVKLFTPDGRYIRRIVKYPQNVGPDQVVRPLNVALASDDKLLVLVRGSHFAQIQVFEYNLELLKVEPRSSICSVS